MIKVVYSIYEGRKRDGDFNYMLNLKEYKNTLFIFNDNEEAFLTNDKNPGGGNAVIRPFSFTIPPRAFGIVTGSLRNGGYHQSLTKHAKKIIDECFEILEDIIVGYSNIKKIIYSAKDESGILGTGIFEVGDEVKKVHRF